MRRFLVLGVAGSTLCTVCDWFHSRFGAIEYPSPALLGEAWWVPLLYFCASIVLVAGVAPVRKILRAPNGPRPSLRMVAGDAIALCVAWIATAFGHREPTALLFVLVGWWLARVVRGRAAWTAIYSLLVAAGGVLIEYTLSSLGGFRHTRVDFFHVPRWLPAIYLHAALLATTLDAAFFDEG